MDETTANLPILAGGFFDSDLGKISPSNFLGSLPDAFTPKRTSKRSASVETSAMKQVMITPPRSSLALAHVSGKFMTPW